MDDKLQKQLSSMKNYSTEIEAQRMQKVVGEDTLPNVPAILSILTWAVVEAEERQIHRGNAGEVLGELLNIAMVNPKAASRILINLDGEEEECNILPMMEAETPEQIMRVMLNLANQTAWT